MNFLKNIKKSLTKGLGNNLSLAIYSIIIAILAWFIVSMTIYPSVPKTITNIPLDIDITGTSAAENDLSIISCNVTSVNVEVLGSRAQVGNLNNENLKAHIDASNVTSTGTKQLAIIVTSDSGIQYQVESISPATATVVFDKYETRNIPVTPLIPNVKFDENKAVYEQEFSCEPNTISITGPSAQLNKISTCYAVSNKDITLDSSYTVTNDEIQLYSEDGALIDQSSLKFNTTSFIINIPVLTQKTVGLEVSVINAPSTFDTKCLNFTMSADSITVASKNSLSEIPDTLEIGKIDLRDLDLGYSKTFELKNVLETGSYINRSNLESVTVSLDDTGLDKKELIINNFSVSNPPDKNYDYEVLTKQLEVTLVGPTDVISEITSADVVADVNLLNSVIATDQFTDYVTITCPKYDNVWAVTNTKISIQRKEKEISTVVEDVSEQ